MNRTPYQTSRNAPPASRIERGECPFSHRHLDDLMYLEQRKGRRNLKAPPNRRTDVQQPDLELQHIAAHLKRYVPTYITRRWPQPPAHPNTLPSLEDATPHFLMLSYFNKLLGAVSPTRVSSIELLGAALLASTASKAGLVSLLKLHFDRPSPSYQNTLTISRGVHEKRRHGRNKAAAQAPFVPGR